MQINTWNQYKRYLQRARWAWHAQAQRLVPWPVYGLGHGLTSAESKHCARHAQDHGLVCFGPAMRRWLKSPEGVFPPGWGEPRDLWRL